MSAEKETNSAGHMYHLKGAVIRSAPAAVANVAIKTQIAESSDFFRVTGNLDFYVKSVCFYRLTTKKET